MQSHLEIKSLSPEIPNAALCNLCARTKVQPMYQEAQRPPLQWFFVWLI